MAFLDVLNASRAVCAGIPGVTSSYRTTPGRAVDTANLPAVVQAAGTVEIDWGTSLDERRYTWSLHVLYRRDGNLQAEEAAILALADTVTLAFYSQTQHGMASLRELRPVGMSEPKALALFEATYTGITLTMYAKTKVTAAFS